MLRCGMIVLWGIEEFNLNKGWPSTGPFTIQEGCGSKGTCSTPCKGLLQGPN